MNKHVKIGLYAGEIWKIIEWAAETDMNYLEMVTDYREDQEPDDAPDSLASIAREGGFSTTKDYLNSAIWDW
jgi:hypothetical protein